MHVERNVTKQLRFLLLQLFRSQLKQHSEMHTATRFQPRSIPASHTHATYKHGQQVYLPDDQLMWSGRRPTSRVPDRRQSTRRHDTTDNQMRNRTNCWILPLRDFLHHRGCTRKSNTACLQAYRKILPLSPPPAPPPSRHSSLFLNSLSKPHNCRSLHF